MRLIFMGTASFAVPSLELLASGPDTVSAVVTQPDRPSGRRLRVNASPVRSAAISLGLAVSQPGDLQGDELRRWIAGLGPDVIVVVAYGKRIPPWLIHHPPRGIVNLHGSLLPRYRGAAPVNWAIARGESRTGVCTMQIDEGLDTGPVYGCRETDIGPEESAPELAGRLARLGAGLLLETLSSIAQGRSGPRPQCGRRATLAPRLRREDGYVRWEESSASVHNKIRAFLPWPAVTVDFRGQRCRLIESRVGEPATGPGEPGDIAVTEGGLAVRCGDGRMLDILKLQLENRRVSSGAGFANGFRLKDGDCFTSLAATPG